MAAQIKRRYLRLVRRAYRMLRSPRLKRHPWLLKLLAPIFNRELWHPCRETVASGLGIGLFVAMLPIPGQMVLAAVIAMRLRANVAIAIAACWVTNPATIPIILPLQANFGTFLHDSVGLPEIPVISEWEGTIPAILGLPSQTVNAGSFITGFVVTALLCFLLAFPLIYALSALMPKLLPKTRYQRAKAKVIARQLKKESQIESD